MLTNIPTKSTDAPAKGLAGELSSKSTPKTFLGISKVVLTIYCVVATIVVVALVLYFSGTH